MLKRIISLSLVASFSLFGAFETVNDADARSRAVANANSAFAFGSGTVLGNPALLSTFDKISGTATVAPRALGLDDGSLLNAAISAVYPLKTIGGGVGIAGSGLIVTADNQNLYNELQGALGYGHNLLNSTLQVGATVTAQKWLIGAEASTEEIKAPITFNANLGLAYHLNQQVSFGLVGANLIGTDISTGTGEKDSVPREIKAGLAYKSPKFLVVMDAGYVIDHSDVNIKMGAETFFLNKKFRLGGGVELQGISLGITPSLGFGYNLGMFVVDYAISYPVNLGGAGTHIASFSFAF